MNGFISFETAALRYLPVYKGSGQRTQDQKASRSMNPEYNFAFPGRVQTKEIRRSIYFKGGGCARLSGAVRLARTSDRARLGTGGIQLTLSLIGPRDVLKVIDQGSDDSVNAVNIKKFINLCGDVATTTDKVQG